MSSRLKLICSMLIFGTIGIFVQNITLSSGEIAFWRSVIALVILGISFALKGGKAALFVAKKDLFLLLISGAAMAANWILLFSAYRFTGVALATLCYYFAPAIVIVASCLIYKEKLSFLQVVCFLAAATGMVIIACSGQTEGGSASGIMMGLAAAACYASVVLINKAIRGIESRTRIFYQFLIAAVILIPYILLTGGFQVRALEIGGLLSLFIVGAVHTGFAYLMYFSALAELPGHETAILSYIDPLTAVLWSVTLLGEPLSPLQILGGLAILAGTLCNELLPKQKP